MAKFAEVAVPGTATSLASLLSLTTTSIGATKCREVHLRSSPGAANDAFFGGAAVTTAANRGGILRATDTLDIVLGGTETCLIDLNDIYLVGTVAGANVVFIAYL